MKNKSLTLSPWGLSLVAALAFVPVANAVVINYQVTQAGSVSPESTLFGPDLHAAGTESWNMDQWSGSTPTVTNMVDSSGVSTGVGITQDGFTGVDDWNITVPLTMLHRSASAFGNGPGNSASFTITGLTSGSLYDLYIATAHTVLTTVGQWSTSNSVNGSTSSTTIILDNTGSESNGTTWVNGVNYVLFSQIQADVTNKITMTESLTTLNGSRMGFSGFQLISVPEPSAALLGGLGLLALLRRRRA
jgi:hypothetical protein